MQLNFEGKTKDEVAIERIRYYSDMLRLPIHLADSGGKDSEVLLNLTQRSGVEFVAEYKVTGLDPYELVKHIKQNHPNTIRIRPDKTMWELLIKNKMPPLRQIRYCCRELKEHNPPESLILTGIRWQESPSRRGYRAMFQVCRNNKTSYFLHPIIDWSTTEVWGYLKQHNIKYCQLYDEGFTRLGCVLCPAATLPERKRHVVRFPEITQRWKVGFQKLNEFTHRYERWEDYFDWWMSQKSQKTDDRQCFMFDN